MAQQQQGAYQLSEIEPETPAAGGGRFRLSDVVDEPPLTRERPPRPAGQLEIGNIEGWAGHHPETIGEHPHAKFGRWATDNLPALASTGAAIATGGASLPVTIGAGILAGSLGAAGREGLHRATGEGAPKTGEELGLDVLKEGATSGGLAALRLPLAVGRVAGPAIAKNARAISTAARGVTGAGPLAGGGMWYATGNPLIGAVTSAATRAMTSPRVIRGVGNLATRVGSSPTVNAIADKLGLGVNAARAAEAFRQTLLQALDEPPTDAAGRPVDAGTTTRP